MDEPTMDEPTMDEPTVTITVKEYEDLKQRSEFLYALEGAGVDNWEGYDYAVESLDG